MRRDDPPRFIQHPGHTRAAIEQLGPRTPPQQGALEAILMRKFRFSPSEARDAARMIQNGEITCPN